MEDQTEDVNECRDEVKGCYSERDRDEVTGNVTCDSLKSVDWHKMITRENSTVTRRDTIYESTGWYLNWAQHISEVKCAFVPGSSSSPGRQLVLCLKAAGMIYLRRMVSVLWYLSAWYITPNCRCVSEPVLLERLVFPYTHVFISSPIPPSHHTLRRHHVVN